MNRYLPLLLIIPVLFFTLSAKADPKDVILKSGDAIAVTLPLSCLATTLALKDYEGLKEGALAGITDLATTYALKHLVQKERPDGTDNYSFPSSHTSVTFTSAAFIQRRYGWKWGIPAYLLSSYTGWSRIYGKKHDWWDVAAGAAIGIGSAYIYTRPFAGKYKLSVSPVATDSHCGFYASLTF